MTRTFETMGQLLQFLEKRDEERTVFEYLCSGQVMGIPGSVFFRQVRRRALQLKRLGFAERELLVEFGYPTQRFAYTPEKEEKRDE